MSDGLWVFLGLVALGVFIDRGLMYLANQNRALGGIVEQFMIEYKRRGQVGAPRGGLSEDEDIE